MPVYFSIPNKQHLFLGQHPLNKVAPSNCRKDNVTKKLLQNKAVKMSLPKMGNKTALPKRKNVCVRVGPLKIKTFWVSITILQKILREK